MKVTSPLTLLICGALTLVSGQSAGRSAESASEWLGKIDLPTSNYIENGSFERGLEGWTGFKGESVTEVDTAERHSGKASLRETGLSDKNYYLYQYDVPLETGRTYTLSAMLKVDGLTEAQRKLGVVTLINYGWTDAVSLSPEHGTTGWKRVSATFKAMPTKPRPDGKPTYSLVIYWMPNTAGKVWIDDIQIEAADKPSPYNETSVIAANKTREGLERLSFDLLDTREVVAKFPNKELAARASGGIEPLLQKASSIRDRLRGFSKLSFEEQHTLPGEVEEVSYKLARLQTNAWLSQADIPLDELKPPAAMPEKLELQLTCVQGEHRDVALNLANLTGQGYAARLAPSALYERSRAVSTPPADWVQLYSAPRMRGFAQPARLFADAFPKIDDAGTVYIEAAAISQAIVSIDTAKLTPGLHEGVLRFNSLRDAAGHLEVKVSLRVLPVSLPALQGIDIADCYGYTDYAWGGIRELGINTFTLNVGWSNATFDTKGALTSFEFDRLAAQVREILEHDKAARFHFLTCQNIVQVLEQRYSWKPGQPEFETAFKAWLAAFASSMNKLGIAASRLRIETIDEPGPADLKPAVYLAGLIKQAAPDMLRQIYLSGIARDEDWQAMAKAHDILTPIAASCTPENMEYLKSLGRQLWIYDCQANGESLHPIAYYRLMPWMSRQYGVKGWSQFSWVNTPHDRSYVAWNGVEAQNVVYPSADERGAVFSRRLLAMRAGHEDYRLLNLLEGLIAASSGKADSRVTAARQFLAEAGTRALALSPRETGYETHVDANVPQDLLGDLRRQTVEHIAALLQLAPLPKLIVNARTVRPGFDVETSAAGDLSIRYLLGGRLPWRELTRRIAAGKNTIDLAQATGEVSRSIVQFTDDDGRIAVQTPEIIPLVTVDSTAEGYSALPLNDGLRVPAVKFEPEMTWISAATNEEHWVALDLQKRAKVNQVSLYWMTYTGLPRQFMIQYKDGANAEWKAVSSTPSWISADNATQQVRFTAVAATEVRVLFARQGGGPGGPSMVGLSEVEVDFVPMAATGREEE